LGFPQPCKGLFTDESAVMVKRPTSAVVMVTGAAGGMGQVHVRVLAENGWTVGACDLDEGAVHELADEVKAEGGNVIGLRVDVRHPSAVAAAVRSLSREGPVLGLVNNAGTGSAPMRLLELANSDFRGMYEVHVEGAVNCMQAVLPAMLDRGYGRIVNIASYCVLKGSIGYGHYCAAKAALVGLSKSVALETAGAGVTVNAVAPGLIDTPMTAGEPVDRRRHNESSIPVGRYGRPEEVAGVVRFLLSDEAGYMTGQTLHVNGGMVLA
jgi:3-oxoacyl-[acyl-carrier protein] reductase